MAVILTLTWISFLQLRDHRLPLNEEIKRRDVEKPHLVIGVIHRPLLIIDLHVALVFGSPFQIEDSLFPWVLGHVFFLIRNLKTLPNEVSGRNSMLHVMIRGIENEEGWTSQGSRPFCFATEVPYFFKITGFCSNSPEVTSSQKDFSFFCQSFPKVVLKKPPSFSKIRFHPGRWETAKLPCAYSGINFGAKGVVKSAYRLTLGPGRRMRKTICSYKDDVLRCSINSAGSRTSTLFP